jgi:hypothetical protein
VELLFKWIRQPLRIKRFFDTPENVVKTQIQIVVSVYVLAAIVKKRLGINTSLYTSVWCLFLESVRDQHPQGHDDEGGAQASAHCFRGELCRQPRADGAGEGVIDDRRQQDAQADRHGFSEVCDASHQNLMTGGFSPYENRSLVPCPFIPRVILSSLVDRHPGRLALALFLWAGRVGLL